MAERTSLFSARERALVETYIQGRVGQVPEAVAALLETHDQLQARLGVILAFARPVDLQAAERHIAEHGFLDAEGNRV